MLDLEELLHSESENNLPDMRSDGVESNYWAGNESGLMDFHNFPGVIYATNGSKSSKGMELASTDTITKAVVAAEWAVAPKGVHQAGPNSVWHA